MAGERAQEDCASWGDEVVLRGEKFYLRHRPEDEPPIDELAFVMRYGKNVVNNDANNLQKALTIRQSDVLRDAKGAIVAVSVYSAGSYNNFKLVVVHDAYRSRGLGTFLGEIAINNLIAATQDKDHPVEITAEADSAEGAKLLHRLKREFGDRIMMRVSESYTELSIWDLPEAVSLCWPNSDFDRDSAKLDIVELFIYTAQPDLHKGLVSDVLLQMHQKLLLDQQMNTVIWLKSGDPEIISIARRMNFEEATNEEYLATLPNDAKETASQEMQTNGFQILVKRGIGEDAWPTVYQA